MPYTIQQLEEKYLALPEDLKEAMIEVSTAENIFDIGKKYSLHVDQIGELADEVGLVMLGLIKAEQFINQIKNRLQISQSIAEAIAREVNEKIFLPIRESLQKLQQEKSAMETTIRPKLIEQTGDEEKLDKDKLLDEIENPAQTPEDTVFEKKLGALFRIPREEVDLDPYLEKPE